MKNLSKKKKILLCVTIMILMAGVVATQMNSKKKAEGIVAKVVIEPEASGVSSTEENISQANPYKTFKVNGDMPEEYVRAADEFLKDDLTATEIFVLGLKGTYQDATVYYCTTSSENTREYLEVLPEELGGVSLIRPDAPSLNTGMTTEAIEEQTGVTHENE